MINAISKVRLWLVLLENKLKDGTKQRGSTKLVERRKNTFDKACSNVLRAVNARFKGIEPNIGSGNKTARDLGTKAGIKQDNKVIEIPEQVKRGNKQVRNLG